MVDTRQARWLLHALGAAPLALLLACPGSGQPPCPSPPLVSCPAPVAAECTGNGSATVTLAAPAACGADTVSGPSGPSTYPLGQTSVRFTELAADGQSSNCTTTVTVVDTAPPTISCPPAQTVECTDAQGATVTVVAPQVADVCGAASVTGPSGPARYPLGPTALQFAALDAQGHRATCSSSVTVVDTAPPMVVCPPDKQVECTGNSSSAVTLGAPLATDACGATVVSGPSGPATYSLGQTTVTFTADDASGNRGSCTTHVTVTDSSPPTATVGPGAGAPAHAIWPASDIATTLDVLADCQLSASDSCQGPLTLSGSNVAIKCVTANEPVVSDAGVDVTFVDATHVKLWSRSAGGAGGRIYRVQLTVQDLAGNAVDAVCRVDIGAGPTFPIDPGTVAQTSCASMSTGPTVVSLSPQMVQVGSGAFTLQVTGTHFTNTSVVDWNGAARPTTFVSDTRLDAAITANDAATAGSAQVTVTTPGAGSSNSITLDVLAGILELISADDLGDAGLGSSFNPTMSGDGRFVSFASLASSLVPGDTNASADLFVRDTCRGPSAAVGCVPRTRRVSLDAAGNQLANGAVVNNTLGPGTSLSADGRYVVFHAQAQDVIANPGVPGYLTEFFWRDTCQGQSGSCAPTTMLLSTGSGGGPANASSREGSISGNGRLAIFVCGASNLVSGPVGTEQLYARDTCVGAPSGCVPGTFLVSATTAGAPANAGVRTAAVDFDGRYVAFQTAASNLVAGDTNGRDDIFLRDTCVGAPMGCTPSTTLVSVNVSGTVSMGSVNHGTVFPSVSGNGRYVLFDSDDADLVTTALNGTPQIFVRDTCLGATGACTPSTSLLSKVVGGAVADSNSNVNGLQLLSSTGRYALFSSFAANLLPGIGAGACYAADTCAGAGSGCTPRLRVVSVDGQGTVLLGATNALGTSGVSALSGDGRFGAFEHYDQATTSTQVYLMATGF